MTGKVFPTLQLGKITGSGYSLKKKSWVPGTVGVRQTRKVQCNYTIVCTCSAKYRF